MDVNQDLLAPCGLYCGVCAIRMATLADNRKFKERLVGLYKGRLPGGEQLKPEDVKCHGCLSDQVFGYCTTCFIKDCTAGKGYESCHQCDEFPCAHISQEFPMPVGQKVILRSIPRWREVGTEQWVAEEEARYTCECGNKLFRGAKRCNKCGVAVDVD